MGLTPGGQNGRYLIISPVAIVALKTQEQRSKHAFREALLVTVSRAPWCLERWPAGRSSALDYLLSRPARAAVENCFLGGLLCPASVGMAPAPAPDGGGEAATGGAGSPGNRKGTNSTNFYADEDADIGDLSVAHRAPLQSGFTSKKHWNVSRFAE